MAVVAEDLLPEWRLRESFVKHAARAQLHRLRAAVRDGAPLDDLFASADEAAPSLRDGGGGSCRRWTTRGSS